MKERTIFKRSVSFLDNDAIIAKIEVEIEQFDPVEKTDWITLERFKETLKVSIIGDYARGCGQIVDDIAPRTEGQKRLLDIWHSYHLGGIMSGTQKQMHYLNGDYKHDYEKFMETFGTYASSERAKIKAYEALFDMYEIVQWDEKVKTLVSFAENNMGNDPFKYIIGVPGDKWDKGHDSKDLYTRNFFMILRGIYIDRGYKYGSSWLSMKVPENIQDILTKVLDDIEEEERERVASMENNKDCADATVEEVQELRYDLNDDEAKALLCLGQELDLCLGEMVELFQSEDENLLYSVGGVEYYVGSDDDLEYKARERLMDDDWLWKEAVQSNQTELGFRDWVDEILRYDGWGHVLGSWDGCENEQTVGDETIYYTRV